MYFPNMWICEHCGHPGRQTKFSEVFRAWDFKEDSDDGPLPELGKRGLVFYEAWSELSRDEAGCVSQAEQLAFFDIHGIIDPHHRACWSLLFAHLSAGTNFEVGRQQELDQIERDSR